MINRKIPWNSQPQVPVKIDWNNPLTRGLVACFVPSSGRNNLVDPVCNFAATTHSPGKFGYGAQISAQVSTDAGVLTAAWSFIVAVKVGSSGSNRCIVGRGPTSPNNTGFGFNSDHSNASYAGAIYQGSGYSIIGKPTGGVIAVGQEIIVGAASAGGSASMFNAGLKVGSATGLSAVNTTGNLSLGRDSDAASSGTYNFYVYLQYNRALSDAEGMALTANPWQIFQPLQRRIWVASGGGTDLAGNASGQAAASAALTTAIPIAAAALSIGTATASLTTAIPVAGVAASVASGSGALTAQVRLSAAALAQAVSSAALSSGIILTAAAVAQAAAAGTLSTAIQLIAAAAAQASASAGLTTGGSGLSADAQATASASAALTIQIQLSAAALAQATSSASLTAAGSGLSASASALSTAQGSVTTQIKLSATALAEAIAVGGLTARIDLSANAITTASASAWLLTAVKLAADASVISAATASLTGGSLSVVRYQALTADAFPIVLTAEVF